MKKRMRFIVPVLLLTAALCVPAGAVSGWETHPFKNETASAQTVQAFLDGLNGDYIVNMQVRYDLTEGFPAIPNTLIDNSYYHRLVSLLKELHPTDGASSGKDAERVYLAVTTDDDTVFFCGDGDRLYVRGSLGEGVFGAEKADVRALTSAVDALPGVAKARSEALRTQAQGKLSSRRSRLLDEAGEIIGYGDELILPPKENPAALRVKYEDVDTVQIYDGARYYVRVTEKADRKRLCNLVNAFEPGSRLEKELSPRTDDDSLRLELRLFDGSKHEYELSDEADNLVADGRLYSDLEITGFFGAVLADAYYRYPTRAAWLGYMNPQRIQSITRSTGTDTMTYTRARYPQKISKLAKELKDLRVYDAIPYRAGKLPEEIRDRAPTESTILTFDSGDVYNVARYGDEYLRVEWVGEKELYLYRL